MSTFDPMHGGYPPRLPPRTSPWPGLLFGGLLLLLLAAVPIAWSTWLRQGTMSTSSGEPAPVTAVADLKTDEKMAVDLYEQASPSVVHVTNLVERRGRKAAKATGTGFVWDDAGHVVTNYHVVQGADAARVTFADRTSYETGDIWAYPDKDLAVLHVPQGKFHPIQIGKSSDLHVGQKVFAIGNPYGLDRTLTTGIISALGREIESVSGRPIGGAIQTNAAINPGNSGGPLLDSAGRLIGVNTAILSPSGTFAGIGFAIPVDEVNRVVPALVARLQQSGTHQGKVVPPKMGVVADDRQSRQLGVTDGVLILKVTPGSPAEKAGLRPTRLRGFKQVEPGDVILAIDDKRLLSVADLLAALEQHQAGDTVTLTIRRDGAEKKVQLQLEAATEPGAG